MISLRITKDRRILAIIGSSFIINALLWVYILRVYVNASDIIPLHTSIYFGVDVLDKKSKLFLIPFCALFFLFVDVILAHLIKKKEKLISLILIAAGAILQIITFIATILLVQNIT